jgi:glycosyltransferase involved in cell wall biosynthesis
VKILWVNSDFLHPTTRGGQIRTLVTLQCLHQGHEIHYAGLDLHQSIGLARSSEYCTKAYAIPHNVPESFAPRFWWQAAASSSTGLPLTVLRYRSRAMLREVETLTRREGFDAVVCDFLASAANIPQLENAVLFQHNVESIIWKRHVEHSPTPWHRAFSRAQYHRMLRYEGAVCRAAKRIIAVSGADAREMQSLYGASRIASVPTGVNIEYFTPPPVIQHTYDLVFLGAMDWRPNIDGLNWFVSSVLPLIRARHPSVSLAVVGRGKWCRSRSQRDSQIHVTGTVADVRPHLWRSAVSIVPLRIGGGTRLKIYEAMAAKVPVVSTSVGAEGLVVRDGENIQIADSPEAFAEHCVALLNDREARRKQAQAAWEMVSACYSWEVISRRFEQLLA